MLDALPLSKCNNQVCARCKDSRLRRDLQYRLLPQVRKSVENLLSLGVNTADILARNAQIVKNIFNKHTLIGNHRTLLTAIDITNIKNQMLRKNWDIDNRYSLSMSRFPSKQNNVQASPCSSSLH